MSNKPESFEVQEYGEKDDTYDTVKVLKQLVQDYRVENNVATHTFNVSLTGDMMKVTVSSYEMNYPGRVQAVRDAVDAYHKHILSFLKKQFKKQTKRELSVVEEKDKADYTVSKVSLNERYMFTSWRVYKFKK